MACIANATIGSKEARKIVVTPAMIAAGAAVLEHDPIVGDRIVAPLIWRKRCFERLYQYVVVKRPKLLPKPFDAKPMKRQLSQPQRR